MNPEISEFSYGYALTSELMSMFGLKAAGAPVFATQHAEGKKGGGWDVKLPTVPVYLQMKRSHRMVRRNAKESTLFSELPFFRMHIHQRHHSDQQELLIDLESRGNLALYAAPAFSQSSELSTHYSSDTVAEHSIFVSPSSIGSLVDDRQHWVSFQSDPRHAYFCSKPRAIDTIAPNTLFSEVTQAMATSGDRQADIELLERVGDEMIEVYASRRESKKGRVEVEKIRSTRDRRSPAVFAQLISRTLYGCELLFFTGEAETPMGTSSHSSSNAE